MYNCCYYKQVLRNCINLWGLGGTYVVNKKPVFLSTPGLQGLMCYGVAVGPPTPIK